MPYIKIVKTRSYFKRFQVKYKRRREGKTDYYARKKLVIQDKNKYNSQKYRLVVRKSNKDIICQIVSATLTSDRVLGAAYSHELKRYGVLGGYGNYASAYATGLLLARRVLKKLNLDKLYDGEFFLVEEGDDRKPFYVLLDVGLARTSTGAKIFGAMKGAVDGGLEIPHKNTRFVGYSKETGSFDPAVLRKYIFGGHVADYMRILSAENPDKYQTQFSVYIKNNIAADGIEAMWSKAHKEIRKNPDHVPTKKPEKPKKQTVNKRKANNKMRKNRIKQKLATAEKKSARTL